jgi:predicted TIM-barrel fold metal-dependent hydrolase
MTIDGYVTLGSERDTIYTADTLVRDLDKAGVDMAVIVPSDREMAVFNRPGNERIRADASRYRDRLIPSCTVNPWYGRDAVREIERAFEDGARMLTLHPTLQGFLINDSLAEPVIRKAEEFLLPVYVHTGPHLYGSPWQVTDCALRFPAVSFILGHAGATDFWNDVPDAIRTAPNLYIEGSFARPFIFRSHIDTVGIERGIMGSSAPRNDLVFEWQQYRDYLPGESYLPVFGENLARLLGLSGGAA